MPPLQALSDALLYEGYLLYPYQPSALKNQYRHLFGTLFPQSFCSAQHGEERSWLEMQCVCSGTPETTLAVRLRFLQLVGDDAIAREQCVGEAALGEMGAIPVAAVFGFPPLAGTIVARAVPCGNGLWMVTVRVSNDTVLAVDGDRNRALVHALASPHVILSVSGGAFASVIDPPPELKDAVGQCRNVGTWPVLVGEPGSARTMLSAPIVLEDYPRIAPESAADFFDGTEMDEMLTLRLLTLSDGEKQEIAETGGPAASILSRAEREARSRLAALHGTWRAPARLAVGGRVRLHPGGRADIFDIALKDKEGTIVAVETDLEGRVYVAVTVDEDPGKDLGVYGHRFFFHPEEVELL